MSKSQVARMAAGLQLKNYLTSKAPEVRLEYQRIWLSFDSQVRLAIKSLVSRTWLSCSQLALMALSALQVLQTLGTEPAHHRSAAQVGLHICSQTHHLLHPASPTPHAPHLSHPSHLAPCTRPSLSVWRTLLLRSCLWPSGQTSSQSCSAM